MTSTFSFKNGRIGLCVHSIAMMMMISFKIVPSVLWLMNWLSALSSRNLVQTWNKSIISNLFDENTISLLLVLSVVLSFLDLLRI